MGGGVRVCVRACVCVSECYSLSFFCLLSSSVSLFSFLFFWGGGGASFFCFVFLPCLAILRTAGS